MDIIPYEIWIHIVYYLEDPSNFLVTNKQMFTLIKYLDNVNEQLIEYVVKNGHFEVVKYICKLVYQTNDSTKYINVNKNDILLSASKYGNLEMIIYLEKRGVNIRTQNNLALISAAEYGHLKVVNFLTEKGCDVRAQKILLYMWLVRMVILKWSFIL